MKKKLLLIAILFSAFFIGITNVNAYDYKAGDLVEIPNPSGESQQFYVVAGKSEKQKMYENICRAFNTSNFSECKSITYNDNYSYNFHYNFARREYSDFFLPDDTLLLISVKSLANELTFEKNITSPQYNSKTALLYSDNAYAPFIYLANIVNSDSELLEFQNIIDYTDAGGLYILELLYSNNDDVITLKQKRKVIKDAPKYLSNYKNAYIDFIYNSDSKSVEWSKIEDFNNNGIILTSGNTIDSEVTGDVYLSLVMRTNQVRLIKSSSNDDASNVSNDVKNIVTSVKNPKTSDMNIYIALLVIGLFTGIIVVSSRRIKKLNKVSR